jgi:5-methylthioadenosine/S-adenosylhomocysteine deaminase
VSLAITRAMIDGQEIAIRVAGGRIAELGPAVQPRDDDEVIDAAGTALVPGLVNGHTHAAMTLFRGYGDALPLMKWLEEWIWPVEARLNDEDVYWGARLACLEMVRNGTVAFWDMYWHPGATAQATADTGLRAVVGAPLIDRGVPSGIDELRESAERSLEAVASIEAGGRIASSLAPHAIYTVSEESLRWIGELSAERELPIHIHLSETEHEVAECVTAHGARPAAYLDRLGLLGPRTLLAHGVWLDEAELALVADRGATVVTNPVANMKLATGGPFPYPAARERGVRVGLGTDGPGSNNSLDLLADAKHFALVQQHAAGDPAAVTAAETWEIATGGRSPILGGEPTSPPRAGSAAPAASGSAGDAPGPGPESSASSRPAPDATGSPTAGSESSASSRRASAATIAVGDPADFLLLRSDAPELIPGELVPNLVYAASGAVVDTTVVAGRVLMRHGAVVGADEVRERAIERARRLGIA